VLFFSELSSIYHPAEAKFHVQVMNIQRKISLQIQIQLTFSLFRIIQLDNLVSPKVKIMFRFAKSIYHLRKNLLQDITYFSRCFFQLEFTVMVRTLMYNALYEMYRSVKHT
jgi:hypothetical protein